MTTETDETTFEEPEITPGSDQPAKETLKVPVSNTPAGIDLDALAAKFGDQIKGAMPKPATPAAPPMTPEEAKKLLNIWEADDDFIQKFGNMDTQKEAFARLRDGLTKQQVTIMQHMMQEQQQQMESRYAPLLEAHARQSEERVINDFHAEYPTLAKPELAPLIAAVSSGLAGKSFANQKEGFAALAKGVEAVIRSHNPDFTLTATNEVAKPQGGQRVRAVGSSSGSGAGGGSQGAGGGPAGNGSTLAQYL